MVDLGDRINDLNSATDAMIQQALQAIFASVAAPRVHLLGNHDVVNLSDAENAALLLSTLLNKFVEFLRAMRVNTKYIVDECGDSLERSGK